MRSHRAAQGAQRAVPRELARGSEVSYSYLSEVERGLNRSSTDILARRATALDMLPSELLRQFEEMSAKGRGLLRKRVFEAAMHELPGGGAESSAPGIMASSLDRPGLPELEELVRIATTLDPEDLRVLLDLARRLAWPPRK